MDTNTQQPQQQQQQRVCPKNCRLCGFQQHAFCAASMALNSFPMLDKLMETLTNIQAEIKELKGGQILAEPTINMNDEQPKENTNNFGV